MRDVRNATAMVVDAPSGKGLAPALAFARREAACATRRGGQCEALGFAAFLRYAAMSRLSCNCKRWCGRRSSASAENVKT